MSTITTLQSEGKVRREILSIARKIGPGNRLPAVRTLSSDLKVSIATLDRAVAKLATYGLVDRQHGRGIFVSDMMKYRQIGMVFFADPMNPSASFSQRLVLGHLHRSAEQKGMKFRLYLSLPEGSPELRSQSELYHDLQEGIIEGVLTWGEPVSPDDHRMIDLAELAPAETPIVKFSNRGTDGSRVSLDYAGMIDQAAKILAQRGCRRIGCLINKAEFFRGPGSCIQQFLQTMSELGLDADESHCISVQALRSSMQQADDSLSLQKVGAEAITRLAGQMGSWDGLISTDDMVSAGALPAMAMRGMVAGRNLVVASLVVDGSPSLQGWEDHLVALRVSPAEIAHKMLELLDARLNNHTEPDREVQIHTSPHNPTVSNVLSACPGKVSGQGEAN